MTEENTIGVYGSHNFFQLFHQWDDAKKMQLCMWINDAIHEGLKKKSIKEFILKGYEAVDKYIEESNKVFNKESKRKITCEAGCNNCCHMHVNCTSPEAKIVLDKAKELGLKLDETRLKQQFILGQGNDQYDKMDASLRQCVFLIDGKCSVYDVRPFACRLLQSVTERSICSSILYPNEMSEYVVCRQAEILATVAQSAIIVKYGEAHGQSFHNFLYKWTKDGLPDDPGGVPKCP